MIDNKSSIENSHLRVVFFGGRHTQDILSSLNKNTELYLVVATEKGIVKASVSNKVPFAQVLNLNEKIIQGISKLKPDIGIVADFGLIIPQKLIDVFPKGIINIHPSLLPKYRGPTPVQSTILNGDLSTGLTIIKIDEKMDHGPILYQEEHKISADDDADKVYAHLFKRSALILPEVLRKYDAGSMTLFEQEHKKATYTKMLKKEDGYINAKNPPGKIRIKRMINGLHPWPGAWTIYKLGNKDVIIKFHPGEIIHVEGKRPMKYKDFINGYENGEAFLKKLNLI